MRLDPEQFASVVVGTIKSALEPLRKRLEALEQRDVLHGKDGAPGPQGEKGEPGARGDVGPSGERGERGEKGEAGERGERGADGAQGLPGVQGEKGCDGKDGRDGQPGIPGRDGERGPQGEKGMDGRDGTHGRDGVLENLKSVFDGERTVTLCFKDGTPIEGGVIKFNVPLYRGLYDASKEYEPGDSVTWGGSMWIAREAVTAIAPDENSFAGKKAWALSVMRGKQGKQGIKGETGDRGQKGDMGPRGPQGYGS